MFKKVVIFILVIAVLAVAYLLISPLFINKMVDEKIEDIKPVTEVAPGVVPQIESKTVSTGNFSGLAGHDGSGTALLIKTNNKYYLRLEDDFKVTNGPDLFVYFGKDGKYDANAKIAELKGNIGGQNYEVPEGINAADFNEVWIWCRAFS